MPYIVCIVLYSLYCLYCTVQLILFILYCTAYIVCIVLYSLYCLYCTVQLILFVLYCTACSTRFKVGFPANENFRETMRKFLFVFQKLFSEILHFCTKINGAKKCKNFAQTISVVAATIANKNSERSALEVLLYQN